MNRANARRIMNFRPRISLNLAKTTRKPGLLSLDYDSWASSLAAARATSPVYVSRYDVTIQSRCSKPWRAFVMDTNEVLTIVVSIMERKRDSESLAGFARQEMRRSARIERAYPEMMA